MADQQDESQEKTEEPTARRLSKAREEGQIARSTEITIAASVISVAIYIYLFGSSLLGNVANIFAKGLVFDSLAVLEPQVAAGRLAEFYHVVAGHFGDEGYSRRHGPITSLCFAFALRFAGGGTRLWGLSQSLL